MYLKKESNKFDNTRLSTQKPKDILKAESKPQKQLYTKLRTKKKILIYIKDNKYFVEHATAFALGFTTVRSIMLDKSKLVEVSASIVNQLKQKDDIDLEFVNLSKEKISTQKPKDILKAESKPQKQLYTKLRTKKKILIYIKDNKYFVEHATAFALGFTTVRSIMLDKSKLVEVSASIVNQLKQKDDIDLEFVNLSKEKKGIIQVYVDSNKYAIKTSAAYSLKMIDDKDFYNATEDYYYISENIVNKLKDNYTVEFISLSFENYDMGKKQNRTI